MSQQLHDTLQAALKVGPRLFGFAYVERIAYADPVPSTPTSHYYRVAIQ